MAGCGKYAILPLFWRPHGRTTRYRYAAKGNSPDLYLLVQQQPRANGPPAGHMANGAPPRQGPPSGPPAPRPRPTSYAGAAGGARSVHHAWSSIICPSSRCLVRAVGFSDLARNVCFLLPPRVLQPIWKEEQLCSANPEDVSFQAFLPFLQLLPSIAHSLSMNSIIYKVNKETYADLGAYPSPSCAHRWLPFLSLSLPAYTALGWCCYRTRPSAWQGRQRPPRTGACPTKGRRPRWRPGARPPTGPPRAPCAGPP